MLIIAIIVAIVALLIFGEWNEASMEKQRRKYREDRRRKSAINEKRLKKALKKR